MDIGKIEIRLGRRRQIRSNDDARRENVPLFSFFFCLGRSLDGWLARSMESERNERTSMLYYALPCYAMYLLKGEESLLQEARAKSRRIFQDR